jgi:hypothetical protein
MNYLPELRASLVAAAARTAFTDDHPATQTSGRRRAPVVIAGAAALVLAALVAALIFTTGADQRSVPLRPVHGVLIAYYGPEGEPEPSAANTHRTAASLAESMLLRLRMPSGSKRVASDPSVGSGLAHATDQISAVNLVDAHAFWEVPGSPDAVIAWFKRRLPSDVLATVASMGGGGNTSSIKGLAVQFPGVPGSVVWRELSIGVTNSTGGDAAIRVDGEAVWQTPRPTNTLLPRQISRVRVVSIPPLGSHHTSRATVVTSASAIRRLSTAIDALPLVQAGVGGCGNDSGAGLQLVFVSESGRTLARARIDRACGIAALRLGDRTTLLTASLPNETTSAFEGTLYQFARPRHTS